MYAISMQKVCCRFESGTPASPNFTVNTSLLAVLLLITCYQRDGCSSSGNVFQDVSIQDCCDNVNGGGPGGIGLGASYQQRGVEGCTPCPVG